MLGGFWDGVCWGGGGEGVEATGGTVDLAHVEEVVEGALDLEGGGMGGVGVELGDGDGVAGGGDELEEVLSEELTMEGVGTDAEEVGGFEGVGAEDGEVG